MSSSDYFQYVNDLVLYAETNLYLPYEDIDYFVKGLCFFLNIDYKPRRVSFEASERVLNSKNAGQFIEPLAEYAAANGRCRSKHVAVDAIISFVCPFPSKINELFDFYCANESVEQACNYLYTLFKRANYLRFEHSAEYPRWVFESEKGKLNIVINSEFDDSAQFGNSENKELDSEFSCRHIPLILQDRQYNFQYLPDNAIPEHFILNHKPYAQSGSDSNVQAMFDFVEIFPHYFVCDDEIIPGMGRYSGSLQGGLAALPLFDILPVFRFSSPNLPDVRLTVPDWYLSVLRIESANKQSVINAIATVTKAFDSYSDNTVGLTGASEGISDNRISVIARINKDDEYTADVILLNDFKDSKHSSGVFGTSEDLMHIRRTPLGTFNAAGAIDLPGRLGEDAYEIKDFVIGGKKLAELADPQYRLGSYAGMIAQLINDNGTSLSEPEAEEAIEKYINKACVRLLRCSQIFNTDDNKGVKAILKFLKTCGFEPVNI